MRRLLPLLAALALTACGPTAQLSALRCGPSCQDTADPFLLRLMLDFEDPSSILKDGELLVKVGDAEVARFALAPVLPPQETAGTIAFPLKLSFPSLEDGLRFTVRARAVVDGEPSSNEVSLPLRFEL